MRTPNPAEPWLRGLLPDVHPTLAAVLRALEQAGEDLPRFTEGLPADQVWSQRAGLSTVGFQLRHIAGSVDRLTTYLRGETLTARQLQLLAAEHDGPAGLSELVAQALDCLTTAGLEIRSLPEAKFAELRYVGRAKLPVTAIGLAIHIAEHTQRHVGQLIVLCRLLRA